MEKCECVNKDFSQWEGTFVIVGVILLVILCSGSPDIIDGIAHKLMYCK